MATWSWNGRVFEKFPQYSITFSLFFFLSVGNCCLWRAFVMIELIINKVFYLVIIEVYGWPSVKR